MTESFIAGLINLILSEGLDTIFDLINGSDYQKVVVETRKTKML